MTAADDDDVTAVRTLAGRWRTEVAPTRGSRFIADAAPVEDESAAFAFLDTVRAREPDATHHCWAYRLPDGRARSADAGEPRDTAGPPILRRIQGAGLTGVVVVVTRYYGGIQLGRGGLVRAYGEAAAAVLADAPVVERPVVVRYRLRFPYELTSAVEAVRSAFDAEVRSSAYGADVELEVAVPVAQADAFAGELAEATAGRVLPAS